MKRFQVFVLSLISPLFLWACSYEDESVDYTNKLSNEEIIENFQHILSENEFDEELVKSQVINKWADPWRVTILNTTDHSRNESYFEYVNRYLNQIEILTKREFLPANPPGNQPNLLILLSSVDQLRNDIRELRENNWFSPNSISLDDLFFKYFNETGVMGCYASYDINSKHEIFRATILIMNELPLNQVYECFEEEIAQSLGLPGDLRWPGPSIFNDDGIFKKLTQHDEYLIQMLYDDRIQPGTEIFKGVEVAREILSEIREKVQ